MSDKKLLEFALRAMNALKSSTASLPMSWVFSCCVIVIAALIWLWKDYQNTVELASIQLANVAQLLETHSAHVITHADAIIDRVNDEIRDHDIMGAGADRRWPALGTIAKRLPVSGRLWLYRADGSAVMASHLRHSTNNANDREYFNAQKKPGTGLFIGETVLGKTTGKKVFNLSRRIDAPDGSFGGVIMAAIDIDVFILAVSELKLGQSAAYTLIGNDGAVIMRYPDAGATGRRFNLKSQVEIARSPVGLINTVSSIDGVQRLLAYRKHASLPLTVVVSLSRDEVLAPWRQRALTAGSTLAVLLILATYLAVLAQRARQRETRAVSRMQRVLETVGDGICGLDAQGSIAFINPAGAHLLGTLPVELIGKNFHVTAHLPQNAGSVHADKACPIQQLLMQGGETQGMDEFVSLSGQKFTAEYTATCVDDLDGKPGVVLAFRDVSATVAAQNALRDQKQFVTAILDSLSEHIAVIDSHGVITAVNSIWRSFAADNGAAGSPQVAVGANYLETCAHAATVLKSKEAAQALSGIRAVLAGELAEFSQEYPCHAPHQQRWFLQLALPLRGAQPGAVIIHQNVTDRHNAETLLRESEARFRLLAENMADIVWQADRHLRFTYINAADQRLRGFPRDEVIGHTIMETLAPQGQVILAEVMLQRQALEQAAKQGQTLRFEIPQRCLDGSEIWIEFTTIPVYDPSGVIDGYQGIGRDVTSRKQDEAQRQREQQQLEFKLAQAAERQLNLQDQANRDPLTGINNRRYFDETLPGELDNARHMGYPLVVIMLDLDHFKSVNDTHGHAAGDEVLKALAAMLRNRARESDIICRYGGEEFVVIMTHMSVERAWQRIESWRRELADMQIQSGDTQIQVTFSAGMAEFPQHGADIDTLLKRADNLLYQAKADGRNCVKAFTADETQ